MCLHRTSAESVAWGDLVTVGCQRLTDPQFIPVPDGDGILVGETYYGVLLFGYLDVTA